MSPLLQHHHQQSAAADPAAATDTATDFAAATILRTAAAAAWQRKRQHSMVCVCVSMAPALLAPPQGVLGRPGGLSPAAAHSRHHEFPVCGDQSNQCVNIRRITGEVPPQELWRTVGMRYLVPRAPVWNPPLGSKQILRPFCCGGVTHARPYMLEKSKGRRVDAARPPLSGSRLWHQPISFAEKSPPI